ncbi:HAD family hydrolase [Aureibaculum luteum]|uniref:capsular biosynthesis protein n=1 Tax=Aureibaculum luteum TaxID=1548456 RepID=UPI0018E59592|nr:capsular biosynthesis protein [Aureibaculum luteum]
MRICIDLDGVISELKQEGQTYLEVNPIEGAIEKIKSLRGEGHYIIINTARHMKTCGSNLGLINARITKMTLDWLEKHDIQFDEIYFGKPWAQVYIDDNAFRFSDWSSINGDGSNFPISNEQKNKKKR